MEGRDKEVIISALSAGIFAQLGKMWGTRGASSADPRGTLLLWPRQRIQFRFDELTDIGDMPTYIKMLRTYYGIGLTSS